MAKQLDLSANWIDDKTLRIAWNDVKANDQNGIAGGIIPITGLLIMFAGFFISFFIAFLGLAILIAGAIWFRAGSTTVRNHVDFSAENITFNERRYSTTSITRFDYGVKSHLTGIAPKKDGNGNSMSDPTMIRMWVNDSAPVTISENNWSFEVCHEIRDALDQALQKVRADEKEATKEATFGKSGDFGVPDY